MIGLLACEKKPPVLVTYENSRVEELPVANMSGYQGVNNSDALCRLGSFKIVNDFYKSGENFVFFLVRPIVPGVAA